MILHSGDGNSTWNVYAKDIRAELIGRPMAIDVQEHSLSRRGR